VLLRWGSCSWGTESHLQDTCSQARSGRRCKWELQAWVTTRRDEWRRAGGGGRWRSTSHCCEWRARPWGTAVQTVLRARALRRRPSGGIPEWGAQSLGRAGQLGQVAAIDRLCLSSSEGVLEEDIAERSWAGRRHGRGGAEKGLDTWNGRCDEGGRNESGRLTYGRTIKQKGRLRLYRGNHVPAISRSSHHTQFLQARTTVRLTLRPPLERVVVAVSASYGPSL
jgi:hypothetical protein